MIARDEMLPLVVAADLTFAPAWQRFLDEWGKETELPLYLALGDLADHLILQLDRGDTDRFPAVFDVVERWIVDGDAYVVNAAVVGLLETIQNICSHGTKSADRFLPWLEPKSKAAWEDLNSFWHGHPHSPSN